MSSARQSVASDHCESDPGDGTDSDPDPDVRVGVGPLSQLFVGYRSFDELRELGSITVERPDRAAALASAFPEQPVWLPERF